MSGMTDADYLDAIANGRYQVIESAAHHKERLRHIAARLRGDGEQGQAVAVWKEHCDAAFEDCFEADRDDPSVRPDIELWRQSWLRALSTQPAPSEQVAASVAVPDWQPIETAPRDGTEILAWDGEDRIVTHWCKFRDGFGDPYEGWIHPNIGELGPSLAMPTHWQTLAAAPVAPEREG